MHKLNTPDHDFSSTEKSDSGISFLSTISQYRFKKRKYQPQIFQTPLNQQSKHQAHAMRKTSDQNGFITMIVVMLAIIIAVVAFAYMRVKSAN